MTDDGYFGNGIYGTPQSEYAVKVYGKGSAVLCFMCIGSPYPGWTIYVLGIDWLSRIG